MRNRTMIITMVLSALVTGALLVQAVEAVSSQAGRRQETKNQPKAQKFTQSERPQDLPAPQTEQPPDRQAERPALDPWQNRQALMRVLGLTPVQQRRARLLQQRLGPKLQQMRDDLEERHDALNQALTSEPLDTKAIEQHIQAILQKQAEVLRAQAEMELGFRQILTPEQLAKFSELQARQREIRRLQREVRRQQRQLMDDLRPQP